MFKRFTVAVVKFYLLMVYFSLQNRRKKVTKRKKPKRAYKSSKSVDSFKIRKCRAKNNKKNNLKSMQREKNGIDPYISRSPSTDSVIYVGTFYYSYPIIDLTKSGSSLEEALNISIEKELVLMDNNMKGNSNALNEHSSAVNIRAPSVRGLFTSVSENTIFNSEAMISAKEESLKNGSNSNLLDFSGTDFKLHHSFPLKQDLELLPQQSAKVNSKAEIVVKEIINNLPDLAIAATEFVDNDEITDGPQIQPMDVDKEEEVFDKMDVDWRRSVEEDVS